LSKSAALQINKPEHSIKAQPVFYTHVSLKRDVKK
jgi:hypothetical protein